MSVPTSGSFPIQRFFQIDDEVRIAGLDWGGDKPLAILCHANGFCAATWSMVAELLQNDYRVVALDARGHGYSTVLEDDDDYQWRHMVDDLLEVVRQLLRETSRDQVELLAGNSLGAIIGAVAAARAPEKFRRVVMLDPPMRPSDEMLAALNLPVSAKGPISIAEQARKRRSVFPSRQAVAESYRHKAIFAQWQDHAFDEYLAHGFHDQTDGQVGLACRPHAEAAIFERTGSVDVFAEARNVKAQVTLVHADKGHFPYSLYEALIDKFPHGLLTSLPGGHLLPMEIPEATAELLRPAS